MSDDDYEPMDHIDWDLIDECSPTDKHPMLYVNWHDALAYAVWAGKR